ncbi:CBS domain-containing protein [Alsobacter sp. SYSU BS001988]
MTTVRHILERKCQQVWSLRPSDTVYDAIRMMADKDVGALAVMEDAKLVGMITERHYARHVFLEGRASPSTLVSEIMERNVLYTPPSTFVEECLALMSAKGVRYLPVIEQEKLLGIVSIGDLVNCLLSDREFEIGQLGKYICGS